MDVFRTPRRAIIAARIANKIGAANSRAHPALQFSFRPRYLPFFVACDAITNGAIFVYVAAGTIFLLFSCVLFA